MISFFLKVSLFKAVKKKLHPLSTNHLHCLGGFMGNKFVLGDKIWRKRRTYANVNKQKQVGEVTDVRLIPGEGFVYDLEFIKGFGGARAETDVKECDISEYTCIETDARPNRHVSVEQGTCK
jgi:hypothetical protein